MHTPDGQLVQQSEDDLKQLYEFKSNTELDTPNNGDDQDDDGKGSGCD